MDTHKVKTLIILTTAAVISAAVAFVTYAAPLRILFTHDSHSHLDNAPRISTLIKKERDNNTLYVDGGDIAMGTLYQAGFVEYAPELRVLGKMGCDVWTLGNHEYDYGFEALADSLGNAKSHAQSDGIKLPELVESSFDFSGELTDEQKYFKKALDDYGCRNYVIKEVNGIKVALFGVEGIESLGWVPKGVEFKDYIDAAKETVKEIGDQADIIICLSHAGTTDSESGEDFDLIKAVPEIDVVISAHSHTMYPKAIEYEGCILGSAGSNYEGLGEMDLDVSDGKVRLVNYRILPVNYKVAEDREIRELVNQYRQTIEDEYIRKYAGGGKFNDVIASCGFDFISLDEMYATHQEYPLGDLIADSYIYEAEKNGINDIDVALVGLGTIRDSINAGDITLEKAFEICSLGVGADGSSGHPLVGAYITGSELKLLVELDASAGPLVNSIKMSYAGLEYEFNDNRMIMGKVTDVHLVRRDGSHEEIDDDKLYKVVCNMYAASMLDTLKDMTKGLLAITPKDADGNAVEDFYDYTLKDTDGNEIKEWVSFKEYLESLKNIPLKYSAAMGRKVKTNEGGVKVLSHFGISAIAIVVLVLSVLVVTVPAIEIRRKKKKAKNEEEKK